MVNNVSPVFLFNKMPRYGMHSGYEQLPGYMQQKTACKTIVPKNSISKRIIGKIYSISRNWPGRNQPDAAAELDMTWQLKTNSNAVAHILYAEYHLLYLDQWIKAPRNITATIHEPPNRWLKESLDYLKRLSSAIVLYQKDQSFFQDLIGTNVRYIAHGVDTEFFVPGQSSQAPRIVFAGVHLRNNAMLRRIITNLAQKHPSLRFDLVINNAGRGDEDLRQLSNHASIDWHHEISDEQLKTIYQNAKLMLLPMNDGGANNAVVESLSAGLPIITTDVGGIADYGGGSIYPLVANNDDQAMLDLIEKYLDDPNWHSQIAQKCRQFAEDKLAWPIIADEHLRFYESLANA